VEQLIQDKRDVPLLAELDDRLLAQLH